MSILYTIKAEILKVWSVGTWDKIYKSIIYYCIVKSET